MKTSGDLIITNKDITSSTRIGTTATARSDITSNVSTESSSDTSSETNSIMSSITTSSESPDMMKSVTSGGVTVLSETDMSSPNRMNIENICDCETFSGSYKPVNSEELDFSPAISDSVLDSETSTLSSTLSTTSSEQNGVSNIIGMESDMEEMHETIAEEEWSPSQTYETIRMKGGLISIPDFQVLTKDLLDKKCWKQKDVADFTQTVSKLNDLSKNAKSFDESIQVLMTTEYRDMMLDLMKKIDTMNLVCAYQGRCNMILNAKDRQDMIRFLNMINTLVDMYLPVLAAFALQIDKMIENTSEACQLDPAYHRLLIDTRNKIFDTMVTRKMMLLNKNANLTTNNSESSDVTSEMTSLSSDSESSNKISGITDLSTSETDFTYSQSESQPTTSQIVSVPVPVPVPVSNNVPVPVPVPVRVPVLVSTEDRSKSTTTDFKSYFNNDNLPFTLVIIFLIIIIIFLITYVIACNSNATENKQ